MTKRKTRTLYMHTLDEMPASFQYVDAAGVSYLAWIGGRNKVKLATSLAQVRREWNQCAETAAAENPGNAIAAREYLARCAYVLVEVPA